jgi:hypothetical protein
MVIELAISESAIRLGQKLRRAAPVYVLSPEQASETPFLDFNVRKLCLLCEKD